jgi:hypothetical protein
MKAWVDLNSKEYDEPCEPYEVFCEDCGSDEDDEATKEEMKERINALNYLNNYK